MKTILILILFVALLVGMFLSCPSPESFDKYYDVNIAPNESMVSRFHIPFTKELGLSHYKYQNLFVFAVEDKDEKVAYIGLFNHWFSKGSTASK